MKVLITVSSFMTVTITLFFIDTVNKMDTFLVSLGYLKGSPEMIHNE